ncbi:MAG: hypothetical protein EZS28_005729 [Streblomastix strix]|uniref:HMG box domain-containing protein n=1 Tax=Streblomastix strix TaxID=222440 RepID=A0A5J4WWR1_9EUKA|nr:MAG: hypothetical protein EZS28_005729 [Streblomastix strix]
MSETNTPKHNLREATPLSRKQSETDTLERKKSTGKSGPSTPKDASPKVSDVPKTPKTKGKNTPKGTPKKGKTPTTTPGKTKTAKKIGPKKALTAYQIYTAEKKEELKKETPELKDTDLVKKIGKLWKELSDEDKAPYTEKAEKDKERYQEEKAKGEYEVNSDGEIVIDEEDGDEE